jgi:hypothetical protein
MMTIPAIAISQRFDIKFSLLILTSKKVFSSSHLVRHKNSLQASTNRGQFPENTYNKPSPPFARKDGEGRRDFTHAETTIFSL